MWHVVGALMAAVLLYGPSVRSELSSCALPEERGSCTDYQVRWFYDTEYGDCLRFWYGGCDGNGNNFATEDECASTCRQPEGRAVCDLPAVSGPCNRPEQLWHFDPARSSCASFNYSGCLGNANRFSSVEECQQRCDGGRASFRQRIQDPTSPSTPEPSTSVCQLPDRVTGTCSEYKIHYSYVQQHRRCAPFYYGGCQGNGNRFKTAGDCQRVCENKVSSSPGDGVRTQQQYQEERDGQRRYDSSRSDGVGTQQENQEERDGQRRYDSSRSDRVRTQQQYQEERDGQRRYDSSRSDGVGTQQQYQEERDDQRRYGSSHSDGVGTQQQYQEERDDQRRYGSSRSDGVGTQQEYQEERDDQRRYDISRSDTRQQSSNYEPQPYSRNSWGSGNDVRDNTRRAEENGRQYHTDSSRHDQYTGQQQEYRQEYSRRNRGRDGDFSFIPEDRPEDVATANSGETRRDQVQLLVEPVIARSRPGTTEHCLLDLDGGPCFGYFLKYFYDAQVGKCRQFVYGGCEGNDNRFDAMDDCEGQCKNPLQLAATTSRQREERQDRSETTDTAIQPSLCHLLPKPGSCRSGHIRYYYNEALNKCLAFQYGGCGGNQNRFDTAGQCEMTCVLPSGGASAAEYGSSYKSTTMNSPGTMDQSTSAEEAKPTEQPIWRTPHQVTAQNAQISTMEQNIKLTFGHNTEQNTSPTAEASVWASHHPTTTFTGETEVSAATAIDDSSITHQRTSLTPRAIDAATTEHAAHSHNTRLPHFSQTTNYPATQDPPEYPTETHFDQPPDEEDYDEYSTYPHHTDAIYYDYYSTDDYASIENQTNLH